MGIVLVRVDDRLLHGQVMEAWVPFCRADCIVVVNNEASCNPVQKLAIKSCASKGIDVEVTGIDEFISSVKTKGYDKKSLLIIVSGLQDAMKLYLTGIKFSSLNIGNIHHNEGGTAMSSSVFIDREDMDYIVRFQQAGVKIDIRGVPSDKPAKVLADER